MALNLKSSEVKTKSKYFCSNNCWQLYFLSALSVFIGGVIYLLLRPVKTIMFKHLNLAGIESFTDNARETTLPLGNYLPEWFIYTLPNGLWAFGYTILILTLWKESPSKFKYFWYATIPVLIFGFELMQLSGTIRGTFGFDDILSGFIGILAGILITKKYKYEKTEV